MRAVAALLLASLSVAGCLSGSGDGDADAPATVDGQLKDDGSIDHDAVARLIGAPIMQEHDHLDPREHTGSFNVEFVAWSSLGVTLGENGFANFVLRDDGDRTLAYVASDGDERGGFIIADITDPADIQVLGSHWVDGNNIQEVRVTPDGRFLAMNVQAIPEQGFFTSPDGLEDCGVCIHLYNIEDPAAPRLVDVLPVELLGTHNLEFYETDVGLYLFYVGQPLAGTNPDPPGNRIGVAELVRVGPFGDAVLVPEATFVHDTTFDDGRSFPHDIQIDRNPLTGQDIAYVSWWEGGAITFDVSNPRLSTAGMQLGRLADAAPSSALAIHWIKQEAQARTDGRLIAWSAPEIGRLDDGTGVIRAMDVSDPANLVQLGTWELPGDLTIDGAYILSPHTAVPDQSTGLLAVAHYHAGVWILDISDPAQPRALGYYVPHGDPQDPYDGAIWWKKPNFDPEGYLPNAYMARWHDGLLWVSERGTGLYALRYTGPVPGPVV